jgi:hypothetical protein
MFQTINRDFDSTTRVIMQANLTSVTILSVPFDFTSTAITQFEGRFISLAATKLGRLATNTDTFVFLAFNDKASIGVEQHQSDIFGTGADIPCPAGGLPGIIGTGFIVGIPTTAWDPAGDAAAIGNIVIVGANGLPKQDSSPAGGDIVFGRVVEVDSQGRHWFTFTSTGMKVV